MLRPKALDHVGLVVADMDRSLRFYSEGLGLTLLRRKPPDAGGVASAVLKVGEQEINVFCDPQALAGPRAGQERIHHFCLTMEAAGIAEVMAALRQAGIAIDRGPTERRDAVSLFVIDPDGVQVEIAVKR